MDVAATCGVAIMAAADRYCGRPAVGRKQILEDWSVPMCAEHMAEFTPDDGEEVSPMSDPIAVVIPDSKRLDDFLKSRTISMTIRGEEEEGEDDVEA